MKFILILKCENDQHVGRIYPAVQVIDNDLNTYYLIKINNNAYYRFLEEQVIVSNDPNKLREISPII